MTSSNLEFRSHFWGAIMRLEKEATAYEMAIHDARSSDEAKMNLKLYRKTVRHVERLKGIVQFHEEQLGQGSFVSEE